jgi:hypothetical protein
MNLYLTTGKRDHLIIVQPGKEFPNSEFCAADGTALTFTVKFIDGKAVDVPRNLGEYLIDKEMAQRSPIMVDLAMAKRLEVQDERVRTHRILTST